MRSRTAITLLCGVVVPLATCANAQLPLGSGWPPPTDTIVVTASMARDVLVPRGESSGICNDFLPPESTSKSDAGPTLFWYRVTPAGAVRDVRLARSSGNSALDAAALECANGAYRRPAIISGKPADVVSVGGVDWAHTPSLIFEPDPEGRGRFCKMYYPPTAVRNNQQGSVIVAYRIGKDGSTADATVVNSSGSRVLDAASVECVKSFRYFPSYQNDQPAQVDESVRFVWRLEGFQN